MLIVLQIALIMLIIAWPAAYLAGKSMEKDLFRPPSWVDVVFLVAVLVCFVAITLLWIAALVSVIVWGL